MLIVVKNWTHHHTHRVFHLVMLTHAVLMTGVILSVFLILAWRAQGESDTIAISAQVEVINDAPTIVESSSNNANISNEPVSPEASPTVSEEITLDHQTPKVDVIVTPEALPELSPAKQSSLPTTIKVPGLGSVPLYHTTSPTFAGRTNIPFAWIYLEIHSAIIKVTTQADGAGNWSWESTEDLDKGLHKIYITSVDPNNESIRATTQYNFYITTATTVKSNVPQNIPAVGNKGTLFDVFVSIPTQFKKIAAGEDIIAKIRLVNFGKAGSPVDVGIQYIIENSAGEVIRQSSETVAVATQISLLKTFFTSPSLSPGMYRFIVRVPSKDIIATAFESFLVTDAQIIPIGNGRLDYTVVFQGMMALILLFSLISYFEYNKVTALSYKIRQANELDLSSQIK